MNEKDTGLQISRKSFISSVVILFTLMLAEYSPERFPQVSLNE